MMVSLPYRLGNRPVQLTDHASACVSINITQPLLSQAEQARFHPTPARSPFVRLKPYLLPPLQFMLIGPGVGALTLLLLAGGNASELNSLFLLFAYGIGVVPAALAGVLYVVIWSTRAFFGLLTIREFGALLGAICGLAALAACGIATSGTPLLKSPGIYLIAMAAGGVCGCLAARIRGEAGTPMDRD